MPPRDPNGDDDEEQEDEERNDHPLVDDTIPPRDPNGDDDEEQENEEQGRGWERSAASCQGTRPRRIGRSQVACGARAASGNGERYWHFGRDARRQPARAHSSLRMRASQRSSV
jgi:hypothetical protein